MSMEKRNVAEELRTPKEELDRKDEHWDKEAAAVFKIKPLPPLPVVNVEVAKT